MFCYVLQAVTLAAPQPGNRSTLISVGGRGLGKYLVGEGEEDLSGGQAGVQETAF